MTSNLALCDVSNELQSLGDPSGRQDSQYWDEWFDIVCRKQNHRSFEWYCASDEVLRVIQYHLQDQVPLNVTDDDQNFRLHNEYAMIHPGSGTSVLPTVLSNIFPRSRQVVVDISKVAIIEMQSIHLTEQEKFSATRNEGEIPHRPLEYVETDLLNDSTTSTTFLDSTFDCWIDKGFVDAIFSDKNESKNKIQSDRLFEEANRILKSTIGFMITITLAEEHSLQIIVNNWLLSNHWQPILHIWELQPASGDLPPYAFVLKKSSGCDDGNNGKLKVKFHPMENAGIDVETTFSDRTATMEQIREIIVDSRMRFSSMQAEMKNAESSVPKLLATIDIKTYEAETDLVTIGRAIQNISWNVNNRSIKMQWQPFTRTDGEEEWFNIVPIGYGISKLQLRCIIDNDDLDELVASIEEWDTDVVQSVDVDWSNTVPMCNLDNILRRQRT